MRPDFKPNHPPWGRGAWYGTVHYVEQPAPTFAHIYVEPLMMNILQSIYEEPYVGSYTPYMRNHMLDLLQSIYEGNYVDSLSLTKTQYTGLERRVGFHFPELSISILSYLL